jgi:hypothetical protein
MAKDMTVAILKQHSTHNVVFQPPVAVSIFLMHSPPSPVQLTLKVLELQI